MKAPFDYETAKQMFEYISKKIEEDACHGNLYYTEHWLRNVKHFKEMKVREVVDFLESHGGYCDCEVLMNVSGKIYWA